MTIHLVADSTADLDPDYVDAHDITLVPLRVIFGDEELRDYFDIQPAGLYERMKSGDLSPRTSQPSPAEFEDVFRKLTDDGSTVVCTTLSSDLSGTWSSATAARQALPDRDIRVVDTKTAAMAHAAIVHEVVRLVESGSDGDRIVAAAEEIKKSQRLLCSLETLEYLRRGGRIGAAQALLGTMLSIKPILGIVDGKVEPVDKVRTFSKALDRLIDELKKAAQEWGVAPVARIAHAANPGPAATLAARAAEITGTKVPVGEVGPVIGVHGGPGAVGITFHKPLASS